MRRSYLLIVFGVSLSLLPSGCSPVPNFWKEASPGQKKILVSFPGNDAYVLSLLTSEGPHDYDGGPTDSLKVRYADLLISNGLSLDEVFVDRMKLHGDNKLKSLNVGKALEKTDPDLLLESHPHVDVDGVKHDHGSIDPHIWLGPQQAMEMTRIITRELVSLDPANKKGYETRCQKFIEALTKLEEYGKKAFHGKKHKNIVTMHESLGYFAKAFGLEIVGSIQARPGMDPAAPNMARLVKLTREKDVKLFAVEPQYSRSQAETLQKSLQRDKIDVRIVVIDPLETAPIPDGKMFNPDPGYYLQKMRENIDTLAEALP